MTSFYLRPATLSDAETIAALHVAVWRQTYRHLAPPHAVATLTEAYRLPLWQARIREALADSPVIVAEQAGRIAGFGAGMLQAPPVYEGRAEIGSLYVAPDVKRQGLGRLLLEHVKALLLAQGARGVGLGVVRGNDPAIAFYQAMGGRIAGAYVDPGKHWRSDNLLMVFDA
ncbi:GNAT family N-acetyltransferase [Rhizobium halophytocola]|uniref:Ribosomal protein S18 acetylase RimI-like enzyme n=1 Tax=Rhizobium halophytocola TaxID=735519 RepID=A0ABS4DSE4_9HYPH|nr:GNAT family N-acetyltransferase [Rhizobium halophytocola]MBP1848603.1 ribosomal protein S18 acetylase RimI-like enzyme [Rhizobium halophytocola]